MANADTIFVFQEEKLMKPSPRMQHVVQQLTQQHDVNMPFLDMFQKE